MELHTRTKVDNPSDKHDDGFANDENAEQKKLPWKRKAAAAVFAFPFSTASNNPKKYK
jgi:hypothetical protein